MSTEKTVYILGAGFSIPGARMVHKNTKIHVVLYKGKKNQALARKYKEECQRYAQFFSTRKVGDTLTFEPNGVTAFVRKLTRGTVRGR